MPYSLHLLIVTGAVQTVTHGLRTQPDMIIGHVVPFLNFIVSYMFPLLVLYCLDIFMIPPDSACVEEQSLTRNN